MSEYSTCDFNVRCAYVYVLVQPGAGRMRIGLEENLFWSPTFQFLFLNTIKIRKKYY